MSSDSHKCPRRVTLQMNQPIFSEIKNTRAPIQHKKYNLTRKGNLIVDDMTTVLSGISYIGTIISSYWIKTQVDTKCKYQSIRDHG